MDQPEKAMLDRAKELVLKANLLPTSERATFVADACKDDDDLHELVSLLLDSGDSELSRIEEVTGLQPTELSINRSSEASTAGFLGSYRLLEQIGEGGFGIVYAAEQRHPVKRRVAVKVLKAGMDTQAVLRRFEAERKVLEVLDHPNIARVLDAGETTRGLPYFVMELVKGEPILAYCDRHRLSTRQRLKLFISVCRAVWHAHSKGVVHRDLKPTNILVTLVDGNPTPKVIDFGIAKAAAGSLSELSLYTEQGVMIGTPAFMSPEQAEMTGLDIDERSDIYSLGVVLYQLLSGTLPFDPNKLQRNGYAELVRILREVEPAKPSTRVMTSGNLSMQIARQRATHPQGLKRELKGELDWIVSKAMEKDRSRRYATASEFASDIERHLRSKPVLAGRPSVFYRLRKMAVSNRSVLTSVFLTLILTCAAFVFWSSRNSDLPVKGANQPLAGMSLQDNSIAVLPFENMSADPEQVYFSDGVSEEILNLLAQIEPLRVISRSSSFNYRGEIHIPTVAEELGVKYVLEGSVRKSGDQVRITAQLIEAASDSHVWSETFDRKLDDIFKVQDEVAAHVSRELKVQILDLPRHHVETDPETYDLYLRTLHQIHTQTYDNDLWSEIGLLQQVLESDPSYAPAVTHLSTLLWYATPNHAYSKEDLRDWRIELTRDAYADNPDDPGANIHLAIVRFEEGDEESGFELLTRALELAPNNVQVLQIAGYTARMYGQLEASVALFKRAVARERLCVQCYSGLHGALGTLERYDSAIEVARRRLTLFGDDDIGGHINLGQLLLNSGDPRAALEEFEFEPNKGFRECLMAMAYFDLGQTDQVQKFISKLTPDSEDVVLTHCIGALYAHMGNQDEALHWLRKFMEENSETFRTWLWDPRFKSLRETPQWLEWRRQARLDDPTLERLNFNFSKYAF